MRIFTRPVRGIMAQNSEMIRTAAANLEKVEEDLHKSESKIEANSAKGLEIAHQRKVDSFKKKIDAATKKKEAVTKEGTRCKRGV